MLQREFEAATPDQRWAADFTYIWTLEGWPFLAVVLDLYSRRVVGWSMRSRMTWELVADALLMAVWRRGWPTHLLHHSDQGSRYTSEYFQRLLADHVIQCSMSRRGRLPGQCGDGELLLDMEYEKRARLAQGGVYEARGNSPSGRSESRAVRGRSQVPRSREARREFRSAARIPART